MPEHTRPIRAEASGGILTITLDRPRANRLRRAPAADLEGPVSIAAGLHRAPGLVRAIELA